MKLNLQNVRAYLSNNWYFFKIWFYGLLHEINPSWHDYEWHWVLECGCCGYEGAGCRKCHKSVIIGYVGYSWPPIESGDYVEYGE